MESRFLDQIKEDASRYGQAIGHAGQLHLIGIVSRVLGLFLLIFTLTLLALALFSFVAVAAVAALAAYMPVWAAALIIGSVYVVLIVIAILCRRTLFVHPFIKLLSKHLIATQEQLEVEVMKADHEVELENVRIAAKVENATLAFDFYAGLVNRAWDWLTGKLKQQS